MKKAVIVIDMPRCCKDCFRYQADPWFGGSCTQAKEEDGWNKHIGADDEYSVQSWCPLRPHQEAIPIEWIKKQKVDFQNEDYPFNYLRGVQDGYNDCIDTLIMNWEEENERDQISEHKE